MVLLYMYIDDPGGLTLKKLHVRDLESRRHDPQATLLPAVHTSKEQQMHGDHHRFIVQQLRGKHDQISGAIFNFLLLILLSFFCFNKHQS